MSEADALLLESSLRMSEPDSALEQGWLLSEMEERLGYSIDDLAKRFALLCSGLPHIRALGYRCYR